MRLNLHTENKALNRALSRMVEEVGVELGTIVKRTARLAAVELAFRTQPYGKSNEVKTKGQNAVRRDIKRVYQQPGALLDPIRKSSRNGEYLAAKFWAAYKAGNTQLADSILKAAGLPPLAKWDSGEAHRAARNRRGQVPKKTKPLLVSPTAIKRLETYIRKQQKKVGYVKSGWAASARQLGGTRGIPGWVTRNRGRARVIDRSSRRVDPSVFLENLVAYVGIQLSDRHYSAALQVVGRNLLKSADRMIVARLRKNKLT